MGKLAEIKTKQTTSSVEDFVNQVAEEQKRKDCLILIEIMEKATSEKAKMWGKSMIGFGSMIYKSPTTEREVEWLKIGFSPRKANFSIFPLDFKTHEISLQNLGKHKTGVGCLYINKLEDIELKTLEEIINVALKNK